MFLFPTPEKKFPKNLKPQTWTHLDQPGHSGTHHRKSWISLDQSGQIWTNLNTYTPNPQPPPPFPPQPARISRRVPLRQPAAGGFTAVAADDAAGRGRPPSAGSTCQSALALTTDAMLASSHADAAHNCSQSPPDSSP